ncbi:hypothetical protein AMTRI_Chr10g4250 [Amborella trichopoda]
MHWIPCVSRMLTSSLYLGLRIKKIFTGLFWEKNPINPKKNPDALDSMCLENALFVIFWNKEYRYAHAVPYLCPTVFNVGPESRVKNPCNTCWKALISNLSYRIWEGTHFKLELSNLNLANLPKKYKTLRKVLLWGIPLNLFSNLYLCHSNIFLRWSHA